MMRILAMIGTFSIACLMTGVTQAAVDLPVAGDGYVSPQTVDGAETVTAEQAYDLWKQRVVFIDVRKNADWEAGRIPGAVHIVYDPKGAVQDLTADTLIGAVAKDEPVVIYCNGSGCDRSSWSCALAVEWGWSKVFYFRDGFPAWQKAGYPVE